MQEKKKIFQPKVIIGSITSFIVAAVGVVAVFFPDLFNLQKKSLNEAEFIVKSIDDVSKFETFIQEHQGKAIKLSIGYCPSEYDANIYGSGAFINFSSSKRYTKAIPLMIIDGNKQIYLNQLPAAFFVKDFMPNSMLPNGNIVTTYSFDEQDDDILEKYKIKAEYIDEIFQGETEEDRYSFRVNAEVKEFNGEEGIVTLRQPSFDNEYELIGGRGSIHSIKIKGDEDYVFFIGTANYLNSNASYDKIVSACNKTGALDDTTPVAFLEGYFFVNEMKGVEMKGEYTTILDPISRKEFELKNY